MTGLPAARVTDTAGNAITQGSETVFIGDSSEGDSPEPSACEPAVGAPVNPILGVKLLPSETDVSLPGPMPFTFSRSYVSSNTQVGILGTGWSCSGDGMHVELESNATIMVDGQGRRLRFGLLTPGAQRFSATESLWLRRGGRFVADAAYPELREPDANDPSRWQGCPQAWLNDPSCYLLSRNGSHLCFAPTPSGLRMVGESNRYGYTTRYVWGELGVISEIHDSAGRTYALVYTRVAAGSEKDHGLRLLGIVLANLHGPLPEHFDPQSEGADWWVRYEYNDAGDLVGVIDRSGQRVRQFAWDAQHRLIAHGQPTGRHIRYVWDGPAPEGRVVEQIEEGGLSRRYLYVESHTEVIDSLGRREIYEFAGDGGKRRWTAQQRADGSRIEYAYDAFGRRISSTDALGRVTRYRRDAEGRSVGVTLPDGRTVQRQLDATGQLLSEDGPAGRTIYKRDDLGRLIERVAPDGSIERFAYTNPTLPDRITEHTDALGGVKHLSWSPLGQLIRHQDCSGQISDAHYDAQGQLIETIDALGQHSHYHYDRRGLQIAVDLPDKTRIEQRRDALGQLLAVKQNGAELTRNHWSALGQLMESVDAAGRRLRFVYDVAGRLIALHNENDATTHFAYDVVDRMIEQVGFDGRIQRYHYRADDSIEWMEDAGQTHHYRYDDAGRLIEQRIQRGSVDVLIERLEWSQRGQLAGVQCEGSLVRFEYDEADQLIGETQQQDGWSYQIHHQHKPEERRLASTYGELPELDWAYYGAGHLQSLTLGTVNLEFERDPLHRETARHAWQSQDDGQSPARRSLFIATRNYDALGRPISQQLSREHGERWQREYRFDALGRLTEIDDDEAGPIRYNYDPSGRLIGSRHRSQTHSYRFDPAGNRLPAENVRLPNKEDWRAVVQKHLPDPTFNVLGKVEGKDNPSIDRWQDNRIAFDEKHHYHYDAAGNLIERTGMDGEHMQLIYDARHRPIHVTRRTAEGEEIRACYAYDVLSRRIRKEVARGGTTEITRYGWDGDRLIAEETEEHRRTIIYEPGSFVPLLRVEQMLAEESEDQHGERVDMTTTSVGIDVEAQDDDDTIDDLDRADLHALRSMIRRSGTPLPPELAPSAKGIQIQFFHTDHLGTPLRMTDTNGKELWRAESDDWGAIKEARGNTHQPIRFQGQWEDEETGFYYNRHRYYDPATSHYIHQDPVGLEGGLNVYGYASKNPINAIDPIGLQDYMCHNAGLSAWCPKPVRRVMKPTACYRPLRLFPVAVVGNSLDKSLNSVVGHQHIFFPDRSHIGYGADGIYQEGEDISEYSQCVELDATQEEILASARRLKNEGFGSDEYSLRPRALGGNNCQDFVEQVSGQGGM